MDADPSRALDVEVELLRRVATGDRAAFDLLYDRFAGVLFSTAYQVVSQQEAAEDVLQEVFVQIWEKAPQYDSSRGKPLTWAISLTRNKAIDRLRSLQRRSRLQEEARQEAKTAEPFDARNSFDAAAMGEVSQMLQDAIGKLTTEQREAIELAFFSGLTQAEIAERINEPLSTVKARIRRGMMRLRELVGPKL